MAAISNSLVLARKSSIQIPGFPCKPADQCLGSFCPTNISFTPHCGRKTRPITFAVQATYSDSGRSSNAAAFVGGFILGGLVVGAIGCVYAPQISKALAGADRKELMRKLPKFIYDEEKALEKTRKVLTEKIAQLNAAIDDVSAQLHTNETSKKAATDDVSAQLHTKENPKKAAFNSDELGAAI